MKKIIIIVLPIILLFVIYLISNNNNYTIKIESINSDSITSGSGIVYKKDNDGYYVLTLYHIIAYNDKIYIYDLNKNKQSAKLLYYDDYTDIAILKVNRGKFKVQNARCNDYKIGDNVLIYGINGKKRGNIKDKDYVVDVTNIYGNSKYKSIVINSNIESGDSGSIVIAGGKTIGIISVIDDNYGYAIPICDALNITNKLENNTLYRPNMKAQFKNSESDILGVLVYKIYPNSIISNIETGSIITKINDIRVQNISQFRNELYKYNKNTKVNFEYYYNNTYYIETVVLK